MLKQTNKFMVFSLSMVVGLSFFLSEQTFALESEWVEILIDPKPDSQRTIYLNKNTIVSEQNKSDQYRFVVSIQPTDDAINRGALAEYSTLISSQINCKSQQLVLIEGRLYSERFGKGNLLQQESINQAREPDSNAGDQIIFELVCGKKLKLK